MPLAVPETLAIPDTLAMPDTLTELELSAVSETLVRLSDPIKKFNDIS